MVAFPDLISPIYDEAAKRISRRPVYSNHASSLGGVCERELVYERTDWEKAALPDTDLQLLYEEGDIHEREVLRDIQDAGFKVVEQQMDLQWKEFQITGHIDAVLIVDGKAIPIDVKSMHPHIWDSIAFRGRGVYEWPEVAEAFQKKPWLKRYLGQITFYALLKDVDQGILMLKNKSTGALAQVNVDVNWDYGEELLQRATRINKHVAEGTLPDRIPWEDGKTCMRCRFFAICLPDRVGKDPLAFVDDEVVDAALKVRDATKDHATSFEKADKFVKSWAKAREEMKIAIGDFLVTKNVTATRTTVKIQKLTDPNAEDSSGESDG